MMIKKNLDTNHTIVRDGEGKSNTHSHTLIFSLIAGIVPFFFFIPSEQTRYRIKLPEKKKNRKKKRYKKGNCGSKTL